MVMAVGPDAAGHAGAADSKWSASRLSSPSLAFRPPSLLFATHREDAVLRLHPEKFCFLDADGLVHQLPAALADPVAALHDPEFQFRRESVQV
jgi:hypothetical protein